MKYNIVCLLLDKKLKCSSTELSSFILNYADIIDAFLIAHFEMNKLTPASNTLDLYFKSLHDITKYNGYIVDYLLSYSVTSTKESVEKFLLKFDGNMSKRLPIAMKLIQGVSVNNYDSNILFKYKGDNICGNIAQAYLLFSQDDIFVKSSILNELVKSVKLNADIKVNNKSIKFKKFIMENKMNLSEDINSLCESLGVYKLFF